MVCDYLKDLIDRCPRTSTAYMEALVQRLGEHFNMQSAQRLAQDQLMEKCNQSDGRAWFMKIDKMDQNAVWLPTKWSLLNTAFSETAPAYRLR